MLRASAAVTAITVTVLLAPGLRDSRESEVRCALRACVEATAAQPTKVASPRYLEQSYAAPDEPATAALGRLSIRRLRISAPVVGVGWDREAMSVPNDPHTLGWFTPTAHLDDLAGVSLVAGHVSDSADRPGTLARLGETHIGDVIQWQGSDGGVRTFRVVKIDRYPRATGLPPALFRVDGPHTLRLVTCATREVGQGGFHYTDNLVVSAVSE
jgi:hypothetical protein